MTSPTRPQIAALRGLLTGAGLSVQDGGTGDPVAPCVVLWPSPGKVQPGSLGDPTSYLAADVTTVCCGATTDQAMWVADKVTATLTRATPTVTGRTPQPIECLSETAVQRDDDLAYPLFFTSMRWRFLTTP
jgi:hypothetical protein